MKNNKINSFGFSTLLLSLSSSAFYGTFSSYIIYKTKTDSFLTIIIGFIISLLLSKMVLHLFNKYPNKTYIDRNKPNNISIILYIILSIFTYILLSLRLSVFLSNQYLVNTPNYIILLMILFITYYTSTKDIVTITKVSIITSFISIIIFIFDFISLIPEINIENYYPLFITNPKDIIITSLLFSIYFTTLIVFLNTFKKSQIYDLNNYNKYYYIMMITSVTIIILNIFTTIGVSGYSVNNLFDYPVYTTLKRIHLFSFLDSMENISIMLWILFIINSCNINLFFIKSIIKDYYKISQKKNNIIHFILLIISFLISIFVFKDEFNESYDYILIPTIISILLLLLQFISNIKDRLKS